MVDRQSLRLGEAAGACNTIFILKMLRTGAFWCIGRVQGIDRRAEVGRHGFLLVDEGVWDLEFGIWD